MGDPLLHWIPQVLAKISPVHNAFPKVTIIPAFRSVSDKQELANEFSGAGLIRRLAQLQNPDHDQQHLRQKFNSINDFLRAVLDDDSASLEIPHDASKVLVRMGPRILPLEALGTGVHQVTILASAATVLEGQIVCIEEPELHLHPALQKKLLRYLSDKTDNQYFITTHSAHLADLPAAAIFHVRLEDGASKVSLVSSPAQRAEICLDLGYRPSDLVQANCIIWVEGPSDRLYICHWLKSLNPEFVEGLHFSVMFYGGRLLSHLTANDPEIEDFISLRRLNRFVVVVMDSDKRGRGSKVNETKKRVEKELQEGPGFGWVTQGREIENYIGPEFLDRAVMKVHPGGLFSGTNRGLYAKALEYRNTKGVDINVDKVKVAHYVTAQPADLNPLDLRAQIRRLSALIEGANSY